MKAESVKHTIQVSPGQLFFYRKWAVLHVCVCGAGELYQLKYHGSLEGWAQSVINNTIQGKWKLRVTPVWKIASHMGQKTMHV